MKEDDFDYRRHGQFPAEAESSIRHFRSTIRGIKELDYTGWDNAFDASFDQQSIWIEESARRIPQSSYFCRLTMSLPEAPAIPLSRARGFPEAEQFGRICEINNLIYPKHKLGIAKRLVLAALLIIEAEGFDSMLCVVDRKHEHARDLNTSDFFCDPTGVELVFPSFRYKEDGDVVLWDLLVQTRTRRVQAIKHLQTDLDLSSAFDVFNSIRLYPGAAYSRDLHR